MANGDLVVSMRELSEEAEATLRRADEYMYMAKEKKSTLIKVDWKKDVVEKNKARDILAMNTSKDEMKEIRRKARVEGCGAGVANDPSYK